MKENILSKVVQKLPKDKSFDELSILIQKSSDIVGNIYSYIIYDEEDLYLLQFAISQQDEYNTLTPERVACEVTEIIRKHMTTGESKNNVCGYGQPPVDILLEVLNPLIHKLAKKQHDMWQKMEYEDLVQICRLVILTLYRKGYYIHKRLLERAFYNEVLREIQKDKGKPYKVSLDELLSDGDGDDLFVRDTIPDTAAIYAERDKLDEEMRAGIYLEVKEFILDIITPRQLDQLLRSYSNKHCDQWARSTMQYIKEYLASQGITPHSFDKYL